MQCIQQDLYPILYMLVEHNYPRYHSVNENIRICPAEVAVFTMTHFKLKYRNMQKFKVVIYQTKMIVPPVL